MRSLFGLMTDDDGGEASVAIVLTNKETGAFIGSITEEQLQFLKDQLVEETEEDRDYWLNRAELDVLRDAGADQGLLDLLAAAMAERDEVEIVWDEK